MRLAYQALRHTEEFTLDTDRQAMLVRPLYMNLLDEHDTAYAKGRLIKALHNYGWRLGTGFLSTPLILYVLGDFDLEAAYKLLENEEMPGWLFMPKMGATTIWESWREPRPRAALHPSTTIPRVPAWNGCSPGCAAFRWLARTIS